MKILFMKSMFAAAVLTFTSLPAYSTHIKNTHYNKVKKKVSKPVLNGWIEYNFYSHISNKEIGGEKYTVIKTVVDPSKGIVEFMLIPYENLKSAMVLDDNIQLSADILKNAKIFSEKDFFQIIDKEKVSNDDFKNAGREASFHHFYKNKNKNNAVTKEALDLENIIIATNRMEEMDKIQNYFVFGQNAFDFQFFIRNKNKNSENKKEYFKFYTYKDEAILSNMFEDFYFVEFADYENESLISSNKVILLPKEIIGVENFEDIISNGLNSIKSKKKIGFFFNSDNKFILSYSLNLKKELSKEYFAENFKALRKDYLGLIRSSQNIYVDKEELTNVSVSMTPLYIDDTKSQLSLIVSAKDFPWKNPPIIKDGNIDDYLGVVHGSLNRFNGETTFIKDYTQFFHKKYLKLFENDITLFFLEYLSSIDENSKSGKRNGLLKINSSVDLKTPYFDLNETLVFDVTKIRKDSDKFYVAYIPSIINEDNMYHEVKIPVQFLKYSKYPIGEDLMNENPSNVLVPISELIVGHYGEIRKKRVF